MNELERLSHLWQIAKNDEDAARDRRVDIENQMLKVQPAREEGSDTITTPLGIKVKLTGKITYKADLEKLAVLTHGWPEAMRPIKTEVKADETKLRLIRSESPQLWQQIAPAIETKPAKVGVAVTFPGSN